MENSGNEGQNVLTIRERLTESKDPWNISLQEEQEPRQLSDLGYWYTAEPSGFPRNQSLVPHDRNTPKQWQVLESLPASHIPSKAHSGLENFEVLKTFWVDIPAVLLTYHMTLKKLFNHHYPGVGNGQGGLVCCNSWGHKESDTDWVTELNWTDPHLGASLVAQIVKNLPAMQETWVWSLGQEDALEKATHSSILAWRISQRSLGGYSPWGCKESDTSEWLTFHTSHFTLHILIYKNRGKTVSSS